MMEAASDAHEAKKEYGPSAVTKAGRGAKVLIEDYMPQAEVVYRVMESGMSLGNTVVVLNQWRRRRTLEPISYGCLQRFVRCSAVMVLTKRVCDKIIEAKGFIVPDENFRTGRRARKMHGEGGA